MLVALLAVPALASSVVEDSRSKFVLEDEVLDSSIYPCEDNSRGLGKFSPENSFVEDGNVPSRVYRVALPTKDLPSITVSNQKLVPAKGSYCNEDSLKFKAVSASTPVLRDGLWITDIRVPLLLKQGSSVVLRKNFKLQVKFNAAVAGVNPGMRALSRVENPAAAERFGIAQTSKFKSLRKEAADQTSDVVFLSQFFVGDKNVDSFEEDGLYAVEYRTIRNSLLLLQRQGELEGIKVDEICLYGASPDTLTDMVPSAALRNPNQIFEIPIEIRDHSPNGLSPDGIFGEGDSLVFVGYGNGFWKRCDREDPSFVNGKMDYFHSYSPYSFYQGFLFGRRIGGKGLRLSDKLKTVNAAGADVEWMRYVRAEKDAILRDTYFGRALDWEAHTGKEWFWLWRYSKDTLNAPSSVLNVKETEKLPGLVNGGRQYLGVTFFPHRSIQVGSSLTPGDQIPNALLSSKPYETRMAAIRFDFKVNDKKTSRDATELIPGGNFRIDNPGLKASGNNYSMSVYPGDGGGSDFQHDRFDGYTVAYQWNPSVEIAEWLLPGKVAGIIEIPVESGVQIMKFRNLQPIGLLPVVNGVAKDSVAESEDVRYMAYREGKFRSAISVTGIPVANENVLTKLSSPHSKLEYLIISPEEFVNEAVALAEFRAGGSAVSKIPTSVVTAEDIYRRYTAGRVSPVAIRNYLSYVYSVCPNFKYVLLAGAGNFDYRHMDGSTKANILPPFEKESAVSEDFFSVLDSGERVIDGTYDLDVSVGRLPVYTVEEFRNYNQKAKDYEQLGVMDNSSWRSNFLLSADDGKNLKKDESYHTNIMERTVALIDSIGRNNKERWNFKRVYLVEYLEDAAGQKKDAAVDFMNVLNQGALMTLYYGHGSKTDWAAEGLLKASYSSRLANKGRYTILGSFSCTVGRFDDGGTRSLSEEFLVAKDAGSIASIGATRESYAEYNENLAKSFLKNSLSDRNVKIGESFIKAKGNFIKTNGLARFNTESYVLIGEPVIQLPRSEKTVRLDQKLDTLKALDRVLLSGSVDGMEDGFVSLELAEGRVTKHLDLQVNDMFADVDFDGPMIYTEEIPVKNGRFKTEFLTPRKMSFGDTAAEIKIWAYSSKDSTVGRYWRDNLVIAGVSSYADSLKDSVPPTIQIQPCYGGVVTNFAEGSLIKLQSPACLQVVVSDSTALDYREQADEGISFEIAGVRDPFHPVRYLEQTSKYAKIRMNFAEEQYPAGIYRFKVRAQDVLGNTGVMGVVVDITDDMDAGLIDVYNAPNPVGKKGTTFYFKDLAVNRDSKVNIYIYNQNGKLVQVLKNAVSGVTHWNGRDMHGRLLANGLYHYVVRSEVSAVDGFKQKTWTKKQKLLISR